MAFRSIVRCGQLIRPHRKLSTAQLMLTTHTNQKSAQVKPFDSIPGPKGLPVIGTLFDYLGNDKASRMHEIAVEKFQKYGPIFREDLMNYRYVMLSDPDDVEHVFRNEGKFPVREPTMAYWDKYKEDRRRPHSIGTLRGEEWHKIRRLLNQQMLHPKVVSMYAEELNGVVEDLLLKFRRIRADDQTIPGIHKELFKWSLESIGTVLFETRFGCFAENPSKEAQEFLDATSTLFKIIVSLFIQPVWFDKIYRTKSARQFYDCMDTIYNFGDKFVEMKLREVGERLKEGAEFGEQRAEFLTYLVASKDVTPQEITASLVEILMASVETARYGVFYCLRLTQGICNGDCDNLHPIVNAR